MRDHPIAPPSQEPGNTAPAAAPRPSRYTGPVLLALALSLVITGCWALYRVEANRIAEAQRQREVLRVGLFEQLLRSELRPVSDTLMLLVDGDLIHHYLATGDEAALRSTERRAQLLSRNHPEFDLVRVIDRNGRELVRAEEGGRLTPPEGLRDQSGQDYIRDALTLPPGALYVSAFDLSAEGGEIERPLKPVMRFASTVADAAGNVVAMYVINYRVQHLFDVLQQAVPTMGQRLRMLDSDGYWIKADDPEKEWGFRLPERAQSTLATTHPQLWSRVGVETRGQFDDGGPPFTWLHIGARPSPDERATPLVTQRGHMILASELSEEEWSALFVGVRNIFQLVTPGLVLLTLLSAWLISNWRKSLVQVRSANTLLERRVNERTTELAETNRYLRDHEELLEETGQLAKVGGWELDLATGEGSWTTEVGRLFDLDPDVKPSRDLALGFFPPEARARIAEASSNSSRNGAPFELELEFTSAKSARKWVRTITRPVIEDGRMVRMRGAVQDITERKHGELRLQTQLRRLHLLERTTRAIGERQDLHSILQVVIASLETQMPLDFGCICLYDPLDRDLTVSALGPLSDSLAQRVGLESQTHVPVDENGLARCVQGYLVHESDLGGATAPMSRRLADAGLASMVVAPLLIESHVFGVLVAARSEKNTFSSGDCEFLRQLSEHVALAAHQAQLHGALQAAYEDLTNTQQAVMQQERLRVLGQMASGIAHDINNAISPILLYTSSLLEREPGLSERARHGLRTIQQAVTDVAETVARMRQFYRPREGQGQLQGIAINPLVMQVPDLTRARWQSMPQQQGIDIDLQLDLTQSLPPILGIENEIREALVNLVFNAVDAMPEGGRLTLRTRHLNEGQVAVEVIDTGNGMDEETRRRCLEPFFTTKGERGTGLGLAMVYGVMKRHDGEVEIDSAPGQGTTIRLVFNEAESREKEGTVTMPVQVVRGLRILLVDDDPILLRSLREILELDGHTVLTASHGKQGIDLFRESLLPDAQSVSVVITDLGMPSMDGRAVATGVKQASPGTPVILLTGWGERLLSEGQMVPHVDRVIGKPPRMQDLRAVLAEVAGPAARSR